MRDIPFFHCNLNAEEVKRALCETIDSGRLSEGARVVRFERALEQYFGDDEDSIVTVNSGTAALHLALKTFGVGDGDEVIVPPQTFIATALAVLYCGAKPVFCDVDKYTGMMTADTMLDAITDRTIAVMPVHWGGMECNTENIVDAAHAQGLFVAVDAAQGIGTHSIGDAVCYSFQATKHLTCGDGGAIWFSTIGRADIARRLRWFGISRESPVGELGEREYELTDVGYKYHMNEIAATIGLANLEMLDKTLAHHKAIAMAYNHVKMDHVLKLSDANFGITGLNHSWWFYSLLVDRRDEFARAMKSRGVPVSVVHRRIDRHVHLFPDQCNELEGMDFFDKHQINLPIHMGMSIEDAEWICEQVNKGW